MKKIKKLVAIATISVVTASLFSGCGNKVEKKELTKLKVFSQTATESGIQSGWGAQILDEKFGAQIEVVADLDGKYSELAANGDLGDIVIFNGNINQYKQAIADGLLLDWNTNDLLTLHGADIKAHMGDALAYSATVKPDGMAGDAIYGIGSGMALSSEDHAPFFYTWDIRWDLYSQIGYPTIRDYEDLLRAFKDINALEPLDDSGNKAYATSLWSDWDNTMVTGVKAMATAYHGYDELGMGLYDINNDKYYDALYMNSDGTYGPYLEALWFYNQLYQNGLLDPESRSLDWLTVSNKIEAGGNYFSVYNYMGSSLYNTDAHITSDRIMMSCPPLEATPLCYGMDTVGNDCFIAIGAKTEHPELCMDIINYLCTSEGRISAAYGPKGITWDTTTMGDVYFTDLGYYCKSDPQTVVSVTDYSGTFENGKFLFNYLSWADNAVIYSSGSRERFNYKYWKSYNKNSLGAMEQDWKDRNKVYSAEELLENREHVVVPYTEYVIESVDSKIQSKWDKTASCIVAGSWDAIYAESDAEFDMLVNEMITNAKASGYDECVEWSKNQAANKRDSIKW